MNALSLWFSPIEDIQKKSMTHRDYPFFAAFDRENVVGFVALKAHNKYTVEILNIGVLEKFHRKGIGHRLLTASENYCRTNKYIYLTVKTLDESAVYEPYDKTRAFYFKNGFTPLEVITTFWNEENPCLFLVKHV